jgi:TrmH family RNA methyltransferase
MSEASLARCRVVLVRPHYAGNVGAAARVMRNFGPRELVLVDPVADPRSMDAVMMATKGLAILTSARTVPTLAEAVADCTVVLATSGEVGGAVRKGFWGTPAEAVPALLGALDHGSAAVVFGPEPHGLTLDEIAACHGMIYVPTDETYASLNLAQAVAVVLYELRKQWLARIPQPPTADPPADYAEQERAFAHLRVGLTAVWFLWDERADGLFHVLRQLLVRGRPTRKELDVLHGLAAQLEVVADRWGVTHPRDGRPPKREPESRHEQPNAGGPGGGL